MCGIVGAVAQRDIVSILVEGLKRLAYRGYDSAGIAIIEQDISPNTARIRRQRVKGKVDALETQLKTRPFNSRIGIGHTRWATHGEPTQNNAHPHCSKQRNVAVVHNGIIENYPALKAQLAKAGYEFESDTDTEVVAHLIDYHWQNNNHHLFNAILETTRQLKGAYALAVMSTAEPDRLYAIRRGSPLVIGIGIGEHFVASDPIALLPVTQQFVYLDEGDIAVLAQEEHWIYNESGEAVSHQVHRYHARRDENHKGQYRHHMLKEIYYQPQAITDTWDGYGLDNRLIKEAFGPNAQDLFRRVQRIKIIACGTSYHAGLVAKHWLEAIAKLPCDVDIASEFRYRDQLVEPNTLLVLLSQSGETADTLAALRKAKTLPYLASLAICNVAESALARESDLTFITRAGREIGVAATKTFITQLMATLMLTVAIARQHHLTVAEYQALTQQFTQIPGLVQSILLLDEKIAILAKQFNHAHHAIFLGRGAFYPIAKEGALKLKEISYIHAEAYPAGELKHGPLALVDKTMPVIVLAPYNELFEKLVSNVQEVRARGGQITIFSDERNVWPTELTYGSAASVVASSSVSAPMTAAAAAPSQATPASSLAASAPAPTSISAPASMSTAAAAASAASAAAATSACTLIQLPSMPDWVAPIGYTIPLQLLAYHVAVLKGTDVDQPRNLAKSVTVE